MQIDFHHGATYAACRLGGMDSDTASVVAHAAQYVDDATHDGALQFSDGSRYVRATSAHKTFDHENADAADNRLIWTPFHFLPAGLDDTVDGAEPTEPQRFERRMLCRPDSIIARQMIEHCIEHQNLPFALQRLGVAFHTYADTWAHQQFVGMLCDTNKIRKLTPLPEAAYKESSAFETLSGTLRHVQQMFAGALPVGHAGALTFPDMPFLKWEFERSSGEKISRDNPTDFAAAFKAVYAAAYRYRVGSATADVPLMQDADAVAAERLLRTTIDIDGEARHATWLAAIADGMFTFGKEKVSYVPRGKGSWKYEALGEDPEDEHEGQTFRISPAFFTSNWKRFHDALHYHRWYVLHELLPAHGLSAS